jgi:hypothetical protein
VGLPGLTDMLVNTGSPEVAFVTSATPVQSGMTALNCFRRCPAQSREVDTFSVDFSRAREEGVVGFDDFASLATLMR